MKSQNRVTDRLRTGSIVPAGSRFSAAGRDPSYLGGAGGAFSVAGQDSRVYWYVRKSGSDSSGDGSFSNPWATIEKSVAKIVDGTIKAGQGIRVGPGVYSCDSGAGYLNFNAAPSSEVVFMPEFDQRGSVTIQGSSSATYNLLFANGAKNIRFRRIKFAARVAANPYIIRSVNTLTNITFEECDVIQTADGSTGNYGVFLDPNGGRTVSGIVFKGCRFESSDNQHIPIYLAQGDGVISSVSFENCFVDGGARAVQVNGASGIIFDGCSFKTRQGTAVSFGTDSATGGKPTTAIFRNNNIDMRGSAGGHALLIGNGCVSCEVRNNSIMRSFDHALVLKEHGSGGGTIVSGNTFVGGTGAAVVFKGCELAQVTNNTLVAYSSLGVIYVTAGDTGEKNHTNTITNNVIRAGGSGAVFYWALSADDGDNVCDYNRYTLGSGGFGEIPTGAAGSTLESLRAAWSTYGDGSNDSHSSF